MTASPAATGNETAETVIVNALGARSVVLVGMMGAGKSTVGRRLATRLNLPFVDADQEIEAAAGKSISDIFAEHGEPHFRDGEAKVIARLLQSGPVVLATGGGAVLREDTRARIRAHGVSIWLKADVDTVLRRVRRRSNRPLLQTTDQAETVARLVAEREPVYSQTADIVVVSRDIAHEKIADECLAALADRLTSSAGGVRAAVAFAEKGYEMSAQPRPANSASPAAGSNVIVNVGLDARAYDIVIGRDILDQLGERIAALRPGARTAIVTDEGVARHWLDRTRASLAAAGVSTFEVIVGEGESSKTYPVLTQVCEALIAGKLERNDLVIALGGGVVGDLTGFAASIVRRGMDFVQVPTSLLAQVDSSVGGKTGINSPHGKNLIGAFHQPRLVIADTAVLDTLSPRQFAAGYAEVAKYGVLGDIEFFAWLEANHADVFKGGAAREYAIAQSCRAKAAIVARDEREDGERALLNLGHTFGHALEAATGFSDRLFHGEGVSIGMSLAAEFSADLGMISHADAERVRRHLASVGLPTRLQEIGGFAQEGVGDAESLLALMGQDKKVKRGKLTFILLSELGQAVIVNEVDPARVKDFLTPQTWLIAMDWIVFAVVVLCLVISAYFSGSETALTGASRASMLRLEKQGNVQAGIVNRLLASRERMIGALLLGNNIANIVASVLATVVLTNWFGEVGVLYATGVMTVLVVIFAEVLPKTIAINAPDRIALLVARPMTVIVAILGPLLTVIENIVRVLMRLLGVPLGANHHVLSASDRLRGAADMLHREGRFEKSDRDMLGGLLDLTELQVSDVMVHRTEMVMVDASLPPEQLVREVLATEYTRIPLWRERPENIVGVLHAKDLLRAIRAAEGDTSKVDVAGIMLKPWFVPEMRPLSEQLKAFRRRKTHFALVVDEYGEVEGLVTLEDILEEIVGDISDEHDVSVAGVNAQPDGAVVVDGSVPIRDLNRAMDWHLPDEEATTIAGLVIHEARSIPEAGQSFTFHGFRFRVLRRERNRITALRIAPLPREAEAAPMRETRAGTAF